MPPTNNVTNEKKIIRNSWRLHDGNTNGNGKYKGENEFDAMIEVNVVVAVECMVDANEGVLSVDTVDTAGSSDTIIKFIRLDA
jgi:hypothetical protein